MNGKSYMLYPHYLNLPLLLCGIGTVITPILQLLDLRGSERVYCLSKITELFCCCYCFNWFLAVPLGMWDLSYLTRDQICSPCSRTQNLNYWTAREIFTQLLTGRRTLRLSSIHCQSQDSIHQVTVFKDTTFLENLLNVLRTSTLINIQLNEGG